MDIKGEKEYVLFSNFLGISDEWDALFVSKLFISFSMSVRDTVLKEKLKVNFLRIVLILG